MVQLDTLSEGLTESSSDETKIDITLLRIIVYCRATDQCCEFPSGDIAPANLACDHEHYLLRSSYHSLPIDSPGIQSVVGRRENLALYTSLSNLENPGQKPEKLVIGSIDRLRDASGWCLHMKKKNARDEVHTVRFEAALRS